MDVIAALVDSFKGLRQVAALTGRSSIDERARAFAALRDGELEIIILGITAFNTSVTLTMSSTIIFAELNWTPAIHTQAEDRIYRIGQENPVHILYMCATGIRIFTYNCSIMHL